MKKIVYTLLLLIAAIAAVNEVNAQTQISNPQIICLGATDEPYQVDYLEGGGAGTPGSTYAWTVSTATAVITPNQGPSGSSNRILIDWSATPLGLYTITVIETNNGCPGPPITLNVQITEITATATAPDVLCFGGTTTVTVTGSGGTAPYTGTGTFTVGVGTYTYTVTDANGCSDDVTIVVNEPAAPLTVTPTPGTIDCTGETADVVISATGGTGPYTGTGTFSQSVGTTSYTVTDANGCSETVSVTLTEPTPLVLSFTAGDIQCNGETADVVVSATGGTAPYTGTGTFPQAAGATTYTVTDANGCSETIVVTLAEPTPLVASSPGGQVECNGGTTDIVVSATGGTGPYTGTGTFNVGAGTYTYTVTDANGCTDDVTVTITENSLLTATATATDILCNGAQSTITVNASGGTGPYTGTGTFNEGAGTYDYTVTDSNGCTATTSVTVTEPTVLVLSSAPGIIDCNGGSADVVISASGGTGPYTGTGTFSQTAGTTTYTVTDANGCTETIDVTLTEPAILQLSSTPGTIDCNGGSADVVISATGGTGPYTGTGTFSQSVGTTTYTVTDANGCSETIDVTLTEPTPVVASSPGGQVECNGGTVDIVVTASGGTGPYTGTGTFTVGAGTYTYTVTDANGCTDDVTVTVTENSLLTATATATDILCNGDQSTITVDATGGTGPYIGTGTFNEAAGTYDYTVTDANGCSATTSITITEPAPIVVTVNSETICEGESAVLTASGALTYVWTPSTGLSADTGASVTANPTATTTYTVTGTDANGCTDSEDATVTVNPLPTTSPIFHD